MHPDSDSEYHIVALVYPPEPGTREDGFQVEPDDPGCIVYVSILLGASDFEIRDFTDVERGQIEEAIYEEAGENERDFT